jgi:plasmid stability protein
VRNVTITLDEETARWARRQAADHDTSVSRFVGELLRQHMRAEQGYEAAMSAYLSRSPARLRQRPSPYPQRDELHDRAGLR